MGDFSWRSLPLSDRPYISFYTFNVHHAKTGVTNMQITSNTVQYAASPYTVTI